MEGFCRGCLIKYDDQEELLEYTEKNRRLFIYSTGLQVKRNDLFTFQLCKNCYVNMQQSCRFKKLCRLSDKKFKTYLSLKDAGETLDFCTYLKNSDDNFYLRWAGNSTPANQKKDDDNESTCTSIRNFMQDMLQDTEMPDSEAGIIRQVIEEEADVLDDTLDSQWLQDDVSIATDFRLDFSPFSTSRSVSNDHCYTPRRPDQTPEVNHFGLLDILQSPRAQSNDTNQRKKTIHSRAIDDILSDSLLDNSFGDNFDNNVKTKKVYDEREIEKIENNLITEQVSLVDNQIYQVNHKNYYVDNTLIEQPLTFVEQPETFVEQPLTFVEQPVTFGEQQLTFDGKDVRANQNEYTDDVDRRLDKALQNNDANKEISLQDILGSPLEYPRSTGLSTPTINKILFGEKLDENSSQDQIRLTLEKLNDDQSNDKLYGTVDVKIELEPMSPHSIVPTVKSEDVKEVNELETKSRVEVDECICNICDKKLKDMKALRLHSVHAHGIKMPRTKRKPTLPKCMICAHCGKEYFDKRNFRQHVKRHEINKEPRRCEICGLEFRTERKYKIHSATHFGQRIKDTTKEKATCEICKKTMLKTSLKVHVLKHARAYLGVCEECGHGYYTPSELRDHMRTHTGERPHACKHCESAYKRRNALIKHMKVHTGEVRFICDNCHKGFKSKRNLTHHIRSGRCSDFKRTGKMNKIQRRKANVVTILEIQNEQVAKPFKCVFCHSRHKTLNYLLNHQKKKVCRRKREMGSPPNVIEIIDPGRPCANTIDNITQFTQLTVQEE